MTKKKYLQYLLMKLLTSKMQFLHHNPSEKEVAS